MLVGLGCAIAARATVYVDADAPGGGNGASWTTALAYLQDALAVARDGNDIRVAEGTYKPDCNSVNPTGSGERTASFGLINGVEIYGGYAGLGEPDPNARDPNAYKTILSGDLNGDDGPDFANNGENSYRIVKGADGAVLDGFTITAGCGMGGGMYNYNSSYDPILPFSLTVANCKFSGNSGGGMYNYNYSPTITNCTFSGNACGGVYNSSVSGGNSSPTLTNCTFSGNSGGGMFNRAWEAGADCSPTLKDCTFSGNSGGSGGGMGNFAPSTSPTSPTLINCDFSENSSSTGGGGMANSNSSPTVTNCTFSGNSAWRGGGMSNSAPGGGVCEPELTNCIFSGNSATNGGGMSNVADSAPMLTNCLFSGNVADSLEGGGMYSTYSYATLTNCTFSGNSAGYRAAGMYCGGDGTATVTNCIFWGNDAGIADDEIFKAGGASITFSYCDIRGCKPGGVWDDNLGTDGGGNIGSDPLFVDAAGDNYRLLPDSLCIDAADNTAVPPDTMDLDGDANTTEPIPFDLDGRPRLVDGDCNDTDIVDIGAYEFAYAYFGDFDNQCDVDLVDFSILADQWMQAPGQPSADIAPWGGNGTVDFFDLDVLCDHWLEGSGP